jgi:hypothetical protein
MDGSSKCFTTVAINAELSVTASALCLVQE